MGFAGILAASEVSLFDINSWWWAIQKGLYWVISAIQNAYNYLVGITPVSNSAELPDTNVSGDVLFNLFSDNRITKVWFGFMIFAVVFLIIFLVIGFIKVHFKNEDQLASRGKMVGKSFGAFLTMLLLPIIMFVGVYFVGFFFQFLASAMNAAIGTTGGDTDIANIIHGICLPQFDDVDGAVQNWDITYSQLEVLGINSDYNYVLGMLTSGILIFVLITICTTLVERLIDVIGLYLIGPFTLSRCPLDDGNSFSLWRDLVITRMLSAAGIIIFMYLYFLLMGNMLQWFNPLSTDTSTEVVAKSMVKILFIIGGAFSAKKGSLLVAQLISQNAGVAEGMSQSQSLHMLSSGLAMGSRALFGAMSGIGRGMLMGGRGAGSAAAQAVRGSSAAAGRANIAATAGDNGLMRSSPSGAAGSVGGSSSAAPVGGGVGFSQGAGGAAGSMGAIPVRELGAGGQIAGGANIPAQAGDGGMLVGVGDPGGSFSEAEGGAFTNKNIPGQAGKIAQTRSGFGSAKEALLYSGFSGLTGYGLAKAFGGIGRGVGKVGSVVGSKINSVYSKTEFAKNRQAKKDAKQVGKRADMNYKRYKPEKEPRSNSIDRRLTQVAEGKSKADVVGGKIDKSLQHQAARIEKINSRIQRKYSGKYDSGTVSKMQNVANKNRVDRLASDINKVKKSGLGSVNLGSRYDKFLNGGKDK